MREGWTYKKLGEVSSFQNGFAFKSSLFKKEGLPIVRISDIQDEQIKDDNLVMFKESDYNIKLDNYRIFPNDILIAMSGGTTGKLGINKTNKIFYQNQRVGVIRENDKLLNHFFLYYFLHTKSEESLKIAAGAAQPNLSTAQIKDFVIPLPPLSEQKAIVSRLDSAFAHIDALKANAKKQLDDAKALFQKALEKAMEPKEGWEEKKLKEISSYSIGLTYKPTDVSEIGTIVLRSSNIQDDKLDLNDIVRVNCPIKENLYVKEGDILMCSRNGSARLVGKVAMLPSMNEKMTYGTFMMTIRSDYNPYLFYFFKSDTFRNQIKHGEANMINQITRYMLDEVYVNTPPLSEQQAIVAQLDQLSEKVKKLQEIQDKTIKECDALKQAILREVFK